MNETLLQFGYVLCGGACRPPTTAIVIATGGIKQSFSLLVKLFAPAGHVISQTKFRDSH